MWKPVYAQNVILCNCLGNVYNKSNFWHKRKQNTTRVTPLCCGPHKLNNFSRHPDPPGLKRTAPFRYAYSFVLISTLQHFFRNALIASMSTIETPAAPLFCLATTSPCRSGKPVRMRCSMLGSTVSVVSKSTRSCASPSTSRGAQPLRMSISWSSSGSSRKQGTFFTNRSVFTRTAEAALHVTCGERRMPRRRVEPQEQACCRSSCSEAGAEEGVFWNKCCSVCCWGCCCCCCSSPVTRLPLFKML